MSRYGFLSLMLLLAAIPLPAGAQASIGTYLAPGIGVSGALRIGERRPPVSGWQPDTRFRELEYRTTPDGVVVVVRCSARSCMTAHAVRVGSSESDVLRRYGAPRSQARTADGGVYFEYVGVGFEIAKGAVRSIYAFPIARK
jgi:hypothetical protein